MAYRLLSMNHLTRTNGIKQAEIRMGDGSILVYNIDITLQTDQEFSTAYQKIIDLNNFSLIEPMEQALVHILNDCPDGDEEEDDPEDSIDGDKEDEESINLFKEDELNINLEEWTRGD